MKSSEFFNYKSHIIHEVYYPDYISPIGPTEKEKVVIDPSCKVYNKLIEFIERNNPPKECPYCNNRLENVSDRTWGEIAKHIFTWGGNERVFTDRYGIKCTQCNWWSIRRHYHEGPGPDDDDNYFYYDDCSIYEGIINKFNNDAWCKAFSLFAEELSEFRKNISSLTPHQVERFVGEILSQYYNCEVRHIGRVRDKGIDLIAIKSDTNVAIQVKHRTIGRKKKSESVIPIREFVGAIVAENYSSGLFVTTDEQYSKPAKDYVEQINSRQLIDLNLITVAELKDFLGEIKDKEIKDKQWEGKWHEFERIWNL